MSTTSFYTLFESASGFGLFSVLESEEIGNLLEEVILIILFYSIILLYLLIIIIIINYYYKN